MSSSAVPLEPARRERKKRQTRDRLLQAALTLFERQGYEQTAVREITDAVDVSERTFFRYFASKEDLVISFIRERTELFLGFLAARPAAEEPLAAIRGAFHDSLAEHSATPGGESYRDKVDTYLSVIRLIEATPALLAANLRFLHDHEDEIVRVLAARENVDPATDRRPRLLAAMFGAIGFLASREWREQGCPGPEAMAASFDAYADQLTPALAAHWT
jgi:AcrR family transcriptional regulator